MRLPALAAIVALLIGFTAGWLVCSGWPLGFDGARLRREKQEYAEAQKGLTATVQQSEQRVAAARETVEIRADEALAAAELASGLTPKIKRINQVRLELIASALPEALPEALRVSEDMIELLSGQVAAYDAALAASQREAAALRDQVRELEQLTRFERDRYELASERIAQLERPRWRLRWGVGATAGVQPSLAGSPSPSVAVGLTILLGRS